MTGPSAEAGGGHEAAMDRARHDHETGKVHLRPLSLLSLHLWSLSQFTSEEGMGQERVEAVPLSSASRQLEVHSLRRKTQKRSWRPSSDVHLSVLQLLVAISGQRKETLPLELIITVSRMLLCFSSQKIPQRAQALPPHFTYANLTT